jgi:hypothetical protein
MKPNRSSKLIKVTALIIGALLTACNGRTPTTPPTQIQPTLRISTQVASTALPPNTLAPAATLAPSLTPLPTIAVTFEPSAARDFVSSAFSKLSSAYPFRVTEDTAIGDGQPLHRVAEMNAVDQSHAIFNTGDETIRLGSLLYTKSNGQWSSAQVPLSTHAPANLAAALITNVERAAQVGTEAINGIDSTVLSYDLRATIGQSLVVGSGKVWIGVADGLPRQVTFTGTVNTAAINSLIAYDEFGTAFTIEAPK